MKKIGGIMAFISGAFTLVLGVVGLLVVKDVVHWQWAVDFTTAMDDKISFNASHTITFSVYIGLGFVELLLGYFSLKKARGIASFILLFVFAVTTGFGIYNGIHTHAWGATTIVTLVINGLAAIGLLAGIVNVNK